MPVCTTVERMVHLRSTCPKNSPSLESMTSEEIKALFHDWILVKELNVLACLHFKAASRTWKTILCKNAYNINSQNKINHCIDVLQFYKPKLSGSKENMLKQITNYQKLMVVRHPLDRLVSLWAHKFKTGNSNSPLKRGAEEMVKHRTRLLEQFHPWLSEKEIEAGDPVYFEEMAQYISAGHRNKHWNGPYSRKCNPCIIDFDAVVKLETSHADVPMVINKMLAHKGNDVHEHLTSTTSWNERYLKLLPEYRNVSDPMLQKLVRKYQKDFKQFGYGFERLKTGEVRASCGINTGTYTCC